MIDLHAHVLPGLDDGPATLEEAVTLVNQAHHEGVRAIVASPHGFNGLYNVNPTDVLTRVAELQEALNRAGIGVEILPGMEVYLNLDLLRQLKLGQALGINQTRYVCIELPTGQLPLFTGEMLFDLKAAGYTPVIAHPERNAQVQAKPETLLRLSPGGWAMVSAPSLVGLYGPAPRRTAEALISRGMARFLCSDAHHLKRRPFLMARAVQHAAEIVGKARAEAMVTAQPASLLATRGTAVL